MSYNRTDKVIPIHQAEIDTESKVIAAFERVRAELVAIDSIEDAFKVREKAELLRVLAAKIKASKSTLDEIAAVKVRAERRLGELLAARPETRGGDHKSIEFQKSKDDGESFDTAPTLDNLGVPKHVSRRSQIMAAIPEDLFEARIEQTKRCNIGRDMSTEMWSYAKYLQRERERQERRRAAFEEASRVEPDDHIRIFHGDFREVLNEKIVPTDSVSLLLTDPMYGREHLPLWSDLSTFASRVLKPGNLLVAYSGQTYLTQVLNALEAHLTYVWVAGVRYSYPNNMFPLRIKNSLKLLLLFS